MEVRKGYKQTEVGLIPDDWKVKQLREIAIFYSGGTPSTSNSAYYDGDISWITSSDLNKGIINEVAGRITKLGLDNSSAKMVSAGTLLLALYGATAGVTAITKINAAINQAVLAIIPSKDNSLYLFYLLSYLKNWIIDTYTQGGQPNLSGEIIKSISVVLPPTLAEQEAIAEALSDADALIEAVEQLLTKKRQVKQGAMSELLTGKRRLSGFSGEWEVKTLGEIGECFAGGTPSTFRSDYWDGDIYWLPSGRVQNCILHSPLEDETKITKRGLDESSAKLIKAQSVLVAITGATCANVACLEFASAANQSVVAIEPFDTINYRFLYYSMIMMRNVILSLQSGSAQGGVNLKTVKSIALRFPSLEEQTNIAEILSDMDAEITALEGKLVKARQVKAGMMSELLGGKIRLI